MKNIIIVSKGNIAVAVGDNNMNTVTKNGGSAFLANLEVVNELLMTVPVEPSETVHMYVPDLIQGICSGSAVEYVKTGKTATTDRSLTAEEVDAFKEFYKLYAERILNVRFSQAKYIAGNNAELQELKRTAWNTLSATPVVTNAEPIVVDPDKAIREAIDKQMVTAIENGELDKYAELKKMRDELRPITQVAQTTTVGASMPPHVEFNDVDKAMSDNNSEEGNPIEFKDNNAVDEMPW